MTTSSASRLPAQITDQPGSAHVPVTLADLERAFRDIKDGDTISGLQYALLNKFFGQGVPQSETCVAEFVGTARSVHIPSPFYPDDIASLSPLCADKAGRVYRYNRKTKELVLLLAPASGGAV